LFFPPWSLLMAYVLDLAVGDPRWLPHPIRWIGAWIVRCERVFLRPNGSSTQQRIMGIVFWFSVVGAVALCAFLALRVAFWIHWVPGVALSTWMAFTVLATRSLHGESADVARALEAGDLPLARERLSWIVSRDTSQLEEPEIVRALLETVAENISDGIVAPLFYLALGGPVLAMAYKAVNTMDSMVGYMNDRYRYFGWFAAKVDDGVNWLPARMSGWLLVLGAAWTGLDWRRARLIMKRDANKMKSPNAGYPEAAAAGALGVQLGGSSVYFGQKVEKPTLGDGGSPLTLTVYRKMVRLMYMTSFLAFIMALLIMALIPGSRGIA